MVAGLLRRSALAALSSGAVSRWLAKFRRDRCVIVMMHRFADVNGQPDGHQPEVLRSTLEAFRSAGVRLLDLDEAIVSYTDPSPTKAGRPPAVAFTVDDGYTDFLTVGVPVFSAFDCPVTCFVVPDAIDRKRWFWWDQIDWLLRQVPLREPTTIELAGVPVSLPGVDEDAGHESRERLADRMKAVAEADRLRFLEDLARAIGVSLPEQAPDRYRVLDWNALRAAEGRGVRFGAHTMSHPVLSQCADERARFEVMESVQRVRQELANPSRVFCYPYGRAAEFLERDGALAKAADSDFAVTAIPGILHSGYPSEAGVDWRWRIPRIAFENRRGIIARHLFL
jgi:peptidoglycan/xylan/chitin deacetylase (PgdA/CDA1 family)